MARSSDPILADAIAKRDAALGEAERWSSFVSMYCELKGVPTPDAGGTQQEQSQPSNRGGALAETEAAVINAIRQSNRPLHTRELLLWLEAASVDVGGKDPASTLSARLSRSSAVRNVRPHGWTIVGETVGPVASAPIAVQDSAVSVPPPPTDLADLLGTTARALSAAPFDPSVFRVPPPPVPAIPPMPTDTGGYDEDDFS